MIDPMDALGATLLTLFGIFLSLGAISVVADKRVQRYYVGQPEADKRFPGIVVMAERNWCYDDPVYVTDDIEKAIRVTRRLNRVLDGNRPDEDDDRVRVSSSTSSAIVPYIVVPSR